MRSSTVGFFTPPSTSYSSSPAPSATTITNTTHSAWHSPVPYLFGGLAAMLGLIALALLILACSYWKLSGYLDSAEESARDIETGSTAKAADVTVVKTPSCYEQRVVVIMPGNQNPTCLATPIYSGASSLGDNRSCSCDGPKRSSDGDGKRAESFEAKEERSSENYQSSQQQYQ